MATKGTVSDISTMRRHYSQTDMLRNQAKTWDTMYQTNTLSGLQNQLSLKSNYSEILRDVYSQGRSSQGAISSLNIGDAAKKELLRVQNQQIEGAFSGYSQELQSKLAGVYQNTATTEQAISSQLEKRSEQGASLIQANYDYLGELWKRSLNQENNTFASDTLMNEYLDFSDEYKEGYEPIGDRFGRVKTREELEQQFFTNGKLNIQGAEFFDRMMNYNLEDQLTFRDYLMQNDPDLLQWASSYDPYNEKNEDFQGANIGSFKTAVGLTSDDYTYSFVERFGGWSEEKLKSSFDKLKVSFDKVNVQDSKSVRDTYNTAVGQLEDYAKQLGIDQYFNTENVGFTFEDLKKYAVQYGTKPGGWEQAGDFIINTAALTGTSAALGASIFGTLGSIVPGAGTAIGAGAGAIAGSVLGFIGGLIDASIKASTTRKDNKQAAANLEQQYNNVIMSMTQFALQQRELKENKFYRV